jgi:lipoic acid synthetase
MIMGDICTRTCKFCATKSGKPMPLDSFEPARVAESVFLMKLKHCVITCVDRDDLPDKGAAHWAETVRKIREQNPNIVIELLIPDYQNELLQVVIDSKPNIIGHNLETVERLTPEVRSKVTYKNSLETLRQIASSGIVTKTGIMVGLGETEEEVNQTLTDARNMGVSVVTIGQYLQPSKNNIPVAQYITPEQFNIYKKYALELGYKHVESAPLVRSSYMSDQTNYYPCPVCQSNNTHLYLNCVDHFKTQKSFPIRTCSNCGIGFTTECPAEDELEYYYESDNYISHGSSSGGIVNKVYQMVRNVALNKKRGIVKRELGQITGSLLDIGSGTGHFAAKMKGAGWKTKCVEVNNNARQFSISHFELDAIPPSEISHLHNAEFDCITLWHSLEHLPYLNQYIAEIQRLLKANGICIVAVPNIISYDAKYYKEYWAAYDVPRHLWHFSPDALRFLFESKGFKLLNIKLMPLDVFYISILSERYRKNSVALLSGTCKGLFFAMRTLFNKKGGSSLIYVFTNQD